MTAAKKPAQTRQPMPVRSAMRSILVIEPFSFEDVESKSSFIDCANAVEPRISSPILRVSCTSQPPSTLQKEETHILQLLHLAAQPKYLRVVLRL
jgi:hypothetical protein